MIQHIMLWNYRDEVPQEERARIERALLALPERVPSLRQVECGPVVGGRNQTFSHCFVMLFDDMNALDEYATHPAHMEFATPFRQACAVQVVADVEVADERRKTKDEGRWCRRKTKDNERVSAKYFLRLSSFVFRPTKRGKLG
jgi:Zn-finger domain-containing protein